MKKIISVLLCLAFVLSGVGCSSGGGGNSSDPDPSGTETEESTMTSETASQNTETSEINSGTETVTSADVTTSNSAAATSTSKPAATTSKPANTSSTSTPAKNYNLKMSDFILDKTVHTPNYLNGGFEAYTDYGRHGVTEYFSAAVAEKTIKKRGLGSLYYAPFDGFPRCAGEWVYTFLNLNGYYAGDGMLAEGCGWIVNTPKDDKDALAIMKNWLFKQYSGLPYQLDPKSDKNYGMCGHSMFQHYMGEWGFAMVGAEIGENIFMHQAHLAFTRGAAKQYDSISAIYFSNWNSGTIGTWEQYPEWPQGSSTGGHSPSLLKRSYIMAYMGNVGVYAFEVGSRLAFYSGDRIDSDGCYELSPWGEAMQELVGFSTKNPDVGINYTPLGVVIDYYTGRATYSTLKSGGSSRVNKAFGYFDNTAGDNMTNDLLKMLYPGAAGAFNYVDHRANDESEYQVNTPYGDTHDVLLQNASQKVLNSYPVLLLSGDIVLSKAEITRYKEYVKQGGTLLLNTAFLKFFNEYKAQYNGGSRQDIADGKGKVIIYGPDYSVTNLPSILKEQLKRFVPFEFSKTVEYLVNVKDGSLIVTLINNNGVTKKPSVAPVIDNSKAVDLTVTYTGNLPIKQVKDLSTGKTQSFSGKSVNVNVGAGGYKVLEFVFD